MEGEEESVVAVAAQVRVVRCPKCDKFLPELPIYSVYVCGGCGAALQAKKKNSASNASSANSDGENVKYLEVLESVTQMEGAASEAMPQKTWDSEAKRVEARTNERLVPNGMLAFHSKSASICDNNPIPREPSTSNCEALVRDNDREIQEAKYRRVRSAGNGVLRQSVRLRDRSPRYPIDGILPNAYPGEVLSDYNLESRYWHVDGENTHGTNLDGPSRVRGLEKDRAELIRMLDELRDQVHRSCEITDKPSISVPANSAVDASNSYSPYERFSRLRHGSPQLHRTGSHHSPSSNVQNPGIPHAYTSVAAQQDLHGYGELVAHMRASNYPASSYPWRNFDNYLFGQYDPDPLISYHHEGFYHQPACSCLNCYRREFLPVQGAPLGCNQQRPSYLANNYGACNVDAPIVFDLQRYNSRGANTSLQGNHPRVTVNKKPAQTCEPVAGGAPFTICYNCYEVLQLPNKHPLLGKNEYKLRCGSCSHAIVVKLDGSRLDVSEPALVVHSSAGSKHSSNDSPGSNEHTATDESLLPPYSFSTGSHDAREKDDPSSSSSFSENEHSTANVNAQKNNSQSRDVPLEADMVSRVPSLPLHDHFRCSPSEGSGKGSRSTRSENEKVVLLTESLKQNSVEGVCVANEMNSSDIEFEDPDNTQDSFDVAQNVDHPGTTKTGDSFLTNLIKRSFKINNRTDNGRAKVFINGYPIPDRTVRKAEKLAGPIHPGDYWYDYHSGFWGVMGRPCLGMIPPYIPEFSYPMPKNCAGGNTGIFVNGRELHQKDLDLLVARGLSDSPSRSYRIEISGNVSDEASGEVLYDLGKLAPTVEKMRCGFGMRVPRAIQ